MNRWLAMDKRDARTLTQEAQEELRRQAIKQLNGGATQAAVAKSLEVSRGAVNGWWKRYRSEEGLVGAEETQAWAPPRIEPETDGLSRSRRCSV